MRRSLQCFSVLLALLMIAGCGKSDSETSTPAAAADTSKPMAGAAAATGASQFVGKWFAISEGLIETMEFMKDGTVLLTDSISRNLGAGGSGKTLDYKVLDGGRLSMVSRDGMTAIYEVSFSGEVMELRGEMVMSDDGKQRFQKLKTGETVEQKVKEMAEANAKAYKERTAATEAFFKQKGLVLIFGSTGTSPGIAVDPDSTFAGGFTGKAYHDGPNPHQDQISGSLVPNERERKLQLQITFGPEIAPNKGARGGGTAMLDITGAGSSMKVAGKVQYGNSGTPMDLALKADPAMHDQIVKKFDAELARIEASKKPIIDAMKDYVVITGAAGSGNGSPDTLDKLILVSTDKPGEWKGEGSVFNKASNNVAPIAGPITATVEVNNNKPMLMINSPLRQYQLSLASAGGNKMDGGWFYPGNPQGQGVDFTFTAQDKATHTKAVEDQKAALASIAGPAPLIGTYKARNSGGFSPYTPFILTLTSGANGAMTGTAKFPMQSATLDVKGQVLESLAGPQLVLTFNYSGQDRNSQQMFANFRQPMGIAVAENANGVLKLTATSQATGEFSLARSDDAYRAKYKQTLADALAKGMKFRSVTPYPTDNNPTVFQITVDPATSKLSGTVLQAHPNLFQANSAIVGELKDEDGIPILATEITDPQVGTRFRATYITKLYMHQSENGWIGVAISFPSHSVNARQPLDILELKN